jgi:hypothetical protein
MGDETTGVEWPPKNEAPPKGHLTFFRTSYSLDLTAGMRFEDTVIVEVGARPALTTFHLPAEALRSSSVYFQGALKSDWFDANSRTVALPDTDPAVFDLFARWIVTSGEILVDEEDWKAAYAEYLKWQLELQADKEQQTPADEKRLCPVTVWDFKRTTSAWFLGDYLLSSDFQNHCLGLLYYMNLRFDHLVLDEQYPQDDIDNAVWHWGTVAYVDVSDVLDAWEQEGGSSDRPPLKVFYRDWLMRYWDSYQVSDSDYEALDGIQELVDVCPELAARVLRGLMCWKERRREEALKPLAAYWIDAKAYRERVEYWPVVEGPRSGDKPHRRQSFVLDAPFGNMELV